MHSVDIGVTPTEFSSSPNDEELVRYYEQEESVRENFSRDTAVYHFSGSKLGFMKRAINHDKTERLYVQGDLEFGAMQW